MFVAMSLAGTVSFSRGTTRVSKLWSAVVPVAISQVTTTCTKLPAPMVPRSQVTSPKPSTPHEPVEPTNTPFVGAAASARTAWAVVAERLSTRMVTATVGSAPLVGTYKVLAKLWLTPRFTSRGASNAPTSQPLPLGRPPPR